MPSAFSAGVSPFFDYHNHPASIDPAKGSHPGVFL
jgi:hypothetical protein